MPSSSAYGLLSFWYNTDRQSQPVIGTRDGSGEPSICVTLDKQLRLTLEAWSGSDLTHVMERLGSADLPHDSAWHHVLLTWDTQSSACICYVDNCAYSMTEHDFGGPFDVALGSCKWQVGGTSGRSPNYSGDLAELYFLAGTPVNITDPAVRARFIDPDRLLPIALDAGGLYPFFESHGAVPQIFLSGNEFMFPRNYPGWSATCVSQTDSTPTSQFSVMAGSLTTAADDPFCQPTRLQEQSNEGHEVIEVADEERLIHTPREYTVIPGSTRSPIGRLFMHLFVTTAHSPSGDPAADAAIAETLNVAPLPYTSNDIDAQTLIPPGWSWGTSPAGTPMCIRDADGFATVGGVSDAQGNAISIPSPLARCLAAVGALKTIAWEDWARQRGY
jgi:hypothetical protein